MSSRAVDVSGGTWSSVKSRRWCQQRDGSDGNLGGDVEVEGVHDSSTQTHV